MLFEISNILLAKNLFAASFSEAINITKSGNETIGMRFKDTIVYVPIFPIIRTFQATRDYVEVDRKMLSLILS
jgi:methyl coenzyme M reductase gamma subunit